MPINYRSTYRFFLLIIGILFLFFAVKQSVRIYEVVSVLKVDPTQLSHIGNMSSQEISLFYMKFFLPFGIVMVLYQFCTSALCFLEARLSKAKTIPTWIGWIAIVLVGIAILFNANESVISGFISRMIGWT